LDFLIIFFKNTQSSNFMEIRLVRAELLYVERRTDRHVEANSRFSQFCDTPTIWQQFCEHAYNMTAILWTRLQYDSNFVNTLTIWQQFCEHAYNTTAILWTRLQYDSNFVNTPTIWQQFLESMDSDMVRSHGKCNFSANRACAETHSGGYIFYWHIEEGVI